MSTNLAPARAQRRRRKLQSITMTDVAETAHVSPSTVSLYLRRPDAVAPETGRIIAETIDALGYVPNLMAGGLAGAGAKVVSIIVPSIRNAFFAETVATLQTELAAIGLQVLLGHTEYSEKTEESLVRAALSWSPVAIVLTGLSHGATTRHLLEKTDIPVIEMWELGASAIDMAVGFSHAQVGATAARHLISRGRSRLGFLGARLQEDRRAAQRAEGFISEAARLGVEAVVLNHPAPASTEAGAFLIARARQDHPELDAVACSNDIVALGLLFEAERIGLAVPRDLAVIGFGDLGFGVSCNPSPTTIRPSGELIGRHVAGLIVACMASGERPAQREINTSHVLVQRGSS